MIKISRVFFTTLAFIGALFQILITKAPPEKAFLFNFILFNIGFGGIFAFMEHYYRFNKGAAKICWQPGEFFRKPIPFFNLFLGILGILCIWFRKDFWTVTVIISSVFIFGHGCYELGKVQETVVNGNKPFYYTKFVLSFDLFFPVALIALLVVDRTGM